MYSQGNEEQVIVDYFKEFKGSLLSIGENDGKTFSNALRLIELGWEAVLVEPSEQAFDKLCELHLYNGNVAICNVAIGEKDETGILHESGAHVKNGSDISLVSSLKKDETKRWEKSGVKFTEKETQILTYKSFLSKIDVKHFDFITIDCEGMDLEVLRQIDLTETKLLCIEWNSVFSVKEEILKYTSTFGMDKVIFQSGENLIISK